jgi:hypothetical protein
MNEGAILAVEQTVFVRHIETTDHKDDFACRAI